MYDQAASDLNAYLNARLAMTGIGRDRDVDWYLTFLRKGEVSFFGVALCPDCFRMLSDEREPEFYALWQPLQCICKHEVQVVSEPDEMHESVVCIVEDLVTEGDDETVYSGFDYLEGAASRLLQMGETQAAEDIAACYGDAAYDSVDNMDPMDILILLEEGAERHKDD